MLTPHPWGRIFFSRGEGDEGINTILPNPKRIWHPITFLNARYAIFYPLNLGRVEIQRPRFPFWNRLSGCVPAKKQRPNMIRNIENNPQIFHEQLQKNVGQRPKTILKTISESAISTCSRSFYSSYRLATHLCRARHFAELAGDTTATALCDLDDKFA